MSQFSEIASAIRAKDQQKIQESKQLVRLYESLGLLEGLGEIEKVHMATILNNQMGNILKEATNMTNLGGATFTTGTGEQLASTILPMVRKTFADLISAKEFVSIQPIDLPTGLVFFLDYKYATTKGIFQSGDSVYGTTDTGLDVSGGLYGTGKFTYSLNNISASATATVTSGSIKDVWFNKALSGSVASNEIKLVSVPVSSLPLYDSLGVRGFTLSGSGIDPRANLFMQYTRTTDDGSAIIFVVSGSSANIATGSRTVFYQRTTKDNDRGDYEDRNGSLNIAEYKIEFESREVKARTRKLKGQWTAEASQDIKAYQGIDLESDITSLMAESVAREMDLEVLEMISEAVPAGGSREYWSAENNTVISSDGSAIVPLTQGYYNSQPQWFQTLGTKINKVSNKILQKTVRGEANFMVISPTVANVVESMSSFMSDAEVGKTQSGLGNTRVGSFNSQYKVFKNPYYLEERVLMGFKGGSYLESGAALCPYVPLEVSQIIYNPTTATANKFLMTRVAKTLFRPSFFGDVIVANTYAI